MTWLVATYKHTETGDMSDITVRPGVELPEIPEHKLVHVNVRKEEPIKYKALTVEDFIKSEKGKSWCGGGTHEPPKMKPPYTFFEF